MNTSLLNLKMVRGFQESPVWAALVELMSSWILVKKDMLSTLGEKEVVLASGEKQLVSMSVEEVFGELRFLQGEINVLEYVKELPNILVESIEAEKSKKEIENE